MQGLNGVSDKRVRMVAGMADDVGVDAAARKLGISRETVKRYRRQARRERGEPAKLSVDEKTLRKIAERFSPAELKAIADGGLASSPTLQIPHVNAHGDVARIGVLSDTHLGSVYTDAALLEAAFDAFDEAGVDLVCHCGDVFEGMANRDGHVYELTHLGYTEQLCHGVEAFSLWSRTPLYFIDGNHDRWFQKSAGALIVKDLADRLPNATFLGHDEGDLRIGNASVRLWHGEDGSSYAFSYRTQKIVESFTGGEKPHVLLCGHTHKAFYVYDRHVHCLSGGAIQRQSKWMRSKRHASHTGFWIVEIGLDTRGVTHFGPRWYPAYI